MDSQEPKPSTIDSSDVPGMKEALERMSPEFWKGKSHFARREPSHFEKTVLFPTLTAIRNLTCAIETPSVLVTALPLVQNMRLKRALADIGSVPEGKELVAAATHVPEINLNPDPRCSGGYISTTLDINGADIRQISREISLAGVVTSGTLVATLIHELQHQRQLENKVLRSYSDKIASPIEHLWYTRVTEADAEATTADILWKMKEAGKPGHWNEMKNSGTWMAEVAKAYEKKVKEEPDAVATGSAKRAAFDAWFTAAGGRVQLAYNTQGMLSAPSDRNVAEMHKLGRPFGHLTVADLEKVGDIGPVNYLKLPGALPLDSMQYRGANFDEGQAKYLHAAHDSYAKIENGTYTAPPVSAAVRPAGSSFLSPPAVKTPIAAAVQVAVSLKRPSLKI